MGLKFVDAPPPPQRAPRGKSAGRVTGTLRSDGKPKLVTSSEGRYVAPDSHRAHGTRVKYVIEKCRCLPCTVAAREYNRADYRRKARPDETYVAYVSATKARQHLQMLQTHGIGYKTVAELTGLAPSTLGKILWPSRYRGMGKSRGIRPETETKVLSVQPEHVAGGQQTDGTEFWRMYDELRARRFPRIWIARQLGMNGSGNLRHGKNVTMKRLRAMEQLFEKCRGMEPPRKRSRWDT